MAQIQFQERAIEALQEAVESMIVMEFQGRFLRNDKLLINHARINKLLVN
jgi:hypothetical protein